MDPTTLAAIAIVIAAGSEIIALLPIKENAWVQLILKALKVVFPKKLGLSASEIRTGATTYGNGRRTISSTPHCPPSWIAPKPTGTQPNPPIQNL